MLDLNNLMSGKQGNRSVKLRKEAWTVRQFLEEKMAENWMVFVSTEKGIMKWSKKAGEPF